MMANGNARSGRTARGRKPARPTIATPRSRVIQVAAPRVGKQPVRLRPIDDWSTDGQTVAVADTIATHEPWQQGQEGEGMLAKKGIAEKKGREPGAEQKGCCQPCLPEQGRRHSFRCFPGRNAFIPFGGGGRWRCHSSRFDRRAASVVLSKPGLGQQVVVDCTVGCAQVLKHGGQGFPGGLQIGCDLLRPDTQIAVSGIDRLQTLGIADIGEVVVQKDICLLHPQGHQQQGCTDSGAILAAGAVKDQGQVRWIGNEPQNLAPYRTEIIKILPVQTDEKIK